MKAKLTPQLAYLVGLWKHRRTRDGVGVNGGELITEIFIRESLRLGLTPPDKIILKQRAAFFYHTAYLSLFEKTVEDQLTRFATKNDYSSNFIAGLFDSTGCIGAGGTVFFSTADKLDELMLLRLGCQARMKVGSLVLLKGGGELLEFIKPNLKLDIKKKTSPGKL